LNVNNLSLFCQPLLLNCSLTKQTGALSKFFHIEQPNTDQNADTTSMCPKNVAFIAARSSPKAGSGKESRNA
jgi:hypothetical protein